DGPYSRPTAKAWSASLLSMRVFQKRIASGKPSRSRGPGNNSRKKSWSSAPKERSPLGKIGLVGRLVLGRDDSLLPCGSTPVSAETWLDSAAAGAAAVDVVAARRKSSARSWP